MKKDDLNLSEVREDYLELILRFNQDGAPARLVDIAKHLGVSKATVSDTLSKLGECGYVVYEKYRPVVLTKEGKIIAERTLEKHRLLVRFLTDTLGVPSKESEESACKMEHAIGAKIALKLAELMEAIGEEFLVLQKTRKNPSMRKSPALKR